MHSQKKGILAEQGMFTRSDEFCFEKQRNLVPDSPKRSVLQSAPLNATNPVPTLPNCEINPRPFLYSVSLSAAEGYVALKVDSETNSKSSSQGHKMWVPPDDKSLLIGETQRGSGGCGTP